MSLELNKLKITVMKVIALIFMLSLALTPLLAQNTFPFPASGNVGIGTTSPGAKLSFTNVDATNLNDGITWYNPAPSVYGIYRTAGAWTGPNYQQLKLSFETGIILDPGSFYGKSFVDVQGAGLRVISGKIGIGTDSPNARLHIPNGDAIIGGSPNFNPSNLNASLSVFSKDANSSTIPFYVGQPTGSDIFWVKGNGNGYFLGNVGIGTINPGNFKLAVNGKIWGTEIQVALTNPAPDYVFEKSYSLPTLEEVKSYIDQNKHLPEVPSAKEMETNGVNVGEMNMLLLKKIEELTLYTIEMNKRMNDLSTENKELKNRMNKIENK
jgi:hypothetical protein